MDNKSFPKTTIVHHKGVDLDKNHEFLSDTDGYAIDSCNTRVSDMEGDRGARHKIRGEEILYPNIDNNCFDGDGQPFPDTYVCIGSMKIHENIVEFWADVNSGPSIIRINGVVVCKTPLLPLTADHPLQYDEDESCLGGWVFITDFNVPPMIFNIKDLMTEGGMLSEPCTGKYFADFNINEHLLQLKRTMNRMQFRKLTTDQNGFDKIFQQDDYTGMPPGYYRYSFSYVDSEGNTTSYSEPTPQIPVVRSNNIGCYPYVRSRTTGDYPNIDPASATAYGVHLRFRIDNKDNYSFIRVRRERWNTGDTLITPPVTEIVGVIEITPGQVQNVNILDMYGYEDVVGLDEYGQQMAAIEKAKAIRYFAGRVNLMNISYASRVIDDGDLTILGEEDGTAINPLIKKLGTQGLSSPFNYTYHRHNMLDEKYGWAIRLYDDQGNFTFARSIEGFENFKMPRRRDPVSQFTRDTSYHGTPKAATLSGQVDNVHEVFDLSEAVKKEDDCDFFNILESGSKNVGNLEVPSGCDIPEDYVGSGLGEFVQGENTGFKPFRPTSRVDFSCTGMNWRVNLEASKQDPSEVGGDWNEYDPKGFKPSYFTHGVTFKGVDDLPEWASAFSIVRTKPAGRVVAQGLAHYALNSGGGLFGSNTTKSKNKIWVYLPDLDPDIGIYADVVQGILDTLGTDSPYAITVESPLGFFSEVWSFNNKDFSFTGKDVGIDMITYARILREKNSNSEINQSEVSDMGIDGADGNNYVAYGKYRSAENGVENWDSNSENGTQFNIIGINTTPSNSGRGNYLEIELDGDIFNYGSGGGDLGTNDDGVRNWHEPMYIINIVRKNANVPDQNVTEYCSTGQYTKLESLLGVSTGEPEQKMTLIDERWEDCFDYLDAHSDEIIASSPYLQLKKFIYVEDADLNIRKWLNVTHLSDTEVTSILQNIENNGYADVVDPSGVHQVYGIYTQLEGYETNGAPNFEIVFDHVFDSFSIQFQVPLFDRKVYVRYDNRVPVQVFGGDSTVAESVWAPIDLKYDKDGDPEDGNDFVFNMPFPQKGYRLNPRQLIVNKTTGFNRIQDFESCKFDNDSGSGSAKIRQLLNMFCCESRMGLNFVFDNPSTSSLYQSFPAKNYVMRPYQWNDDESDLEAFYEDNNIYPEYLDDYGNEKNWWGYGGFRFLPQVNIDYVKPAKGDRVITSVPDVGFVEQVDFCTRTAFSLVREVNIQNTPNLRTFLQSNYYDISDSYGHITKAWSALSDRGENLYAFTESGINLLLVNQNILRSPNGNDLAIYGAEAYITKDIWLENQHGLPDEYWRSFAENGNQAWFLNKQDVWSIMGNSVKPIGSGYKNYIYNNIVPHLLDGYQSGMTAVYDKLHHEYRVSFIKESKANFSSKTTPVTKYGLHIVDELTESIFPPSLYSSLPSLDYSGDVILKLFNVSNSPVESQFGVVLGGYSGLVLSQDIILHVDSSDEHAIKVKYRTIIEGVVTWTTLDIEPGEFYKFTFSTDPENILPVYDIEDRYFDAVEYFPEIIDIPFTEEKCDTIVYNEREKAWQGRFSHLFDKYLVIDNQVYGMRDLSTYKLNKGGVLNGGPVKFSLFLSSSPEQQFDKEFIRLRVNSGSELEEGAPKVNIYDNLQQYYDNAPVCSIDPVNFKNYRGFEQYIPRKDVDKFRVQGRSLLFEISDILAEDFKVVDTVLQYKKIK